MNPDVKGTSGEGLGSAPHPAALRKAAEAAVPGAGAAPHPAALRRAAEAAAPADKAEQEPKDG